CTERGHRRDASADIPAHQSWPSGSFQDFAQKRGRCRLAVRAGNGDDFTLKKLSAEFKLADDTHAKRADLRELWRITGNPGTYDDEILPTEGEQAVASSFNDEALI